MPRYQAILFDFDGVLADSEPVHFECWREVLGPLGIQCDWETFSKYCIGIPDQVAVEFLCRSAPTPVEFGSAWDRYPLKQTLFRERMLAHPPVSAATAELLMSLGDYKLAVVTASARSEIEPLLERAGVRACFHAVVCREDVARNKPAPDLYLLAAKLLGVSSALVVEDSDVGAASGAAAGFDVLRVSTPAEVPSLVRQRLDVG